MPNYYALTERRSEESKRIRREYSAKYGKDFSPRRGKVVVPRNDGLANCVTATQTIEQYLLIETADAEEGDTLTDPTTQYTSCALRTRDKGGRGHKLEIRKDDVSNALTQVTKDYLVLECTSNEKGETELTNTTTQPVQQTPFNYIELFAGIGGFRQALDPIGGKCVFASEIDKFATQAYKALYDGADDHLHGDITKIEAVDVPDHDVLVGGFPCQAFSVAGKREGFADKTRGTLFFDIVRIMAEKQPKMALLENVKGLVGHDGGKTLDIVVESLNAIGYHVDFNVMNSKYFGVPQNRERIFIVALRDDLAHTADWTIEGTNVVAKGKRRIAGYGEAKTFNFDWPVQGDVTTRLRDVLEPSVDEKYYLSEEKTAALVAQLEAKDTVIGSVGHHPFSKKVEFNGFNSDISPTLLATDYKAPKTVLEGLPIREETKQGDAVDSDINQGVVEQSPIMLGHVNIKGHDAVKRVYDPSAVGPTLTTMGGGHREPKIAEAQAEALELAKGFMDGADDLDVKVLDNGNLRPHRQDARKSGVRSLTLVNYDQNVSNTVTSAHEPKIYGESTRYRIRKLTPLECFRLQGFPDDAHQTLVDAGISNSQLYKQAGNAVTVNVIDALFDKVTEMDWFNDLRNGQESE